MNNKIGLSDCGKYQIDSTVWYLDFEYDHTNISDVYGEYFACHPIFLLKKTPIKSIWKTGRVLPRLTHEPFDLIINLFTGKLVVKSFVVNSVGLDDTTGEFIYSDEFGELHLPELIIFQNSKEALRERSRILNMIKDWVVKQIGIDYDLFPVRKFGKKQQNKHINSRIGKIGSSSTKTNKPTNNPES